MAVKYRKNRSTPRKNRSTPRKKGCLRPLKGREKSSFEHYPTVYKNLARGNPSHARVLRGVMRGVKSDYSPTLTTIICIFTYFARGKKVFLVARFIFLFYL